MTNTEMKVLLEGIKELKKDFHNVGEHLDLLCDSLYNVGGLTRYLEEGELSGNSLDLFKKLRELKIPNWEAVLNIIDRLEVVEAELENKLDNDIELTLID
ncbi:MAG: hypothetical protein ACE3JP_08230 [Ectobacillus sp.]